LLHLEGEDRLSAGLIGVVTPTGVSAT